MASIISLTPIPREESPPELCGSRITCASLGEGCPSRNAGCGRQSHFQDRAVSAMHFLRVKFLKGGLAGWKAKGYPVERYEKPFHLDTRT
jgi:hypothetical protein